MRPEGLVLTRLQPVPAPSTVKVLDVPLALTDYEHTLDWIDTTITFTLHSRPDDGTTLLFTHADWRETNEFMHGCSTNWGAYLTSLKSGAERGEFAAYPAGEMSRWS